MLGRTAATSPAGRAATPLDGTGTATLPVRRANTRARTATMSPAGQAAKPLYGPSAGEDETGRNAATLLARLATARTTGKAETSSAWRYARLPERTPTERTAGMAVATLARKAGTVPA